jgi:hypothetical protein
VEALDADGIVRISERVVEDAAASGNCVIVGRGSQHFLRSRDDTLRFFLYASREEKISRLISEGNGERDAERLVDTVDRERAAFIKKYFHAEWPNRSLYHAMINTASGDETVIQAILSFLQQHGNISHCCSTPAFRGSISNTAHLPPISNSTRTSSLTLTDPPAKLTGLIPKSFWRN